MARKKSGKGVIAQPVAIRLPDVNKGEQAKSYFYSTAYPPRQYISVPVFDLHGPDDKNYNTIDEFLHLVACQIELSYSLMCNVSYTNDEFFKTSVMDKVLAIIRHLEENCIDDNMQWKKMYMLSIACYAFRREPPMNRSEREEEVKTALSYPITYNEALTEAQMYIATDIGMECLKLLWKKLARTQHDFKGVYVAAGREFINKMKKIPVIDQKTGEYLSLIHI